MNFLKKMILIPVVVLGLAVGTTFIATQTSLLQPVLDRWTAINEGAGTDTSPSSGAISPTSNPSKSNNGTTGAANADASQAATAGVAGQSSETLQFLHNNAASRTTIQRDGTTFVTNPTSVLVLVNKKRELDSDYVPSDLIKAPVEFSFSGTSPKQQMRKVAADALGKLFAGAKEAGIELKAVSGYRSYASQRSVFNAYAADHGEEEANTFSAHPGQSEHQTGLAMDVSSASVHYGLEESYGDTKEGKWLEAHAADYGFIIRFEKDKENETGYIYEPWHVRYVGVYIAKDIQKQGLTLEAYLAKF